MLSYFLMVLLVVGGTLLFQYYFQLKLFNSVKEAVLTLAIPFIATVIANYATYITGFNTFTSISTFRLLGLPIETYMMAIVGPYFVMVVNAYSKRNGKKSRRRY